MCYRPLHLFNPKIAKTTRDKVFIDVPCGKCAECTKRKRNDWFVRAYFEYLYTTQVCKGFCVYVTLTYRNDVLPFTIGFDELEHPVTIPHFSKSDIQKFLKRFRKNFCTRFGKDKTDIKYLICSEYGGETHRPHYHGILFIPYRLSYHEICETKSIINQSWHLGFISYGRKQYDTAGIKGVLDSSAALSYVCKYISKDMNFPYDFKESLSKDALPFHLQSNHFGEYMIDHFGLKSGSQFAFNMLLDGSLLIGNVNMYPYAIPQYVTRKVLYNYIYNVEEVNVNGKIIKIPHVTYDLNELGKEINKVRELHSLEFRISEFDKIFNNAYRVLSHYDNLSYLLSHSRLSLPPYNYSTVDEVREFLEDTYFHSSFNKQNFALYTSIFKDRVVIPFSSYFQFEDDDNLSLHDAMLYLDEIYNNERNLDDIFTSMREYSHKDRHVKEMLARKTYTHDFNSAHYSDYDILLEIFNAVTYCIGFANEQKEIEEKQKYDNAKLLTNEAI